MPSMHPASHGLLVLLAVLACSGGAFALPSSPPPATRPQSAAANPLRRPTSWSEAWAALAPYRLTPTTAAAPCGTGPTTAAACGEANIKSLWSRWKSIYKVQYRTTAVDALRYGFFKQTVQQLILKMQKCPVTVWVGLNAQADWSPNELKLRRKIFVPTRKPGDAVVPKSGPLPAAWDWRWPALDKVTPAKDQGRCGSCFAFVAAAAVESKLLIQYNKTYSSYQINLSEQAIIDCVNAGQGYTSSGCGGGYLEEPLNYAARWFLTKEALYPFTSGATGLAGACNQTRITGTPRGDKVQLVGTGFRQLRQWSATALKEAVLVSPVMVGMNVPDNNLFEFYSGGVLPASSCPLPAGVPTSAKAVINHAVLLVGWNSLAKTPYWIIKNSWGSGEKWGNNGFGYIEMLPDGTYGACSMYYYAVAPTELVPTDLPVVPEPAKTSVRLVNSANPANKTAGRLEVQHNGVWGTVCDDGFSSAAATVVCRQLGKGTVGVATPGGSYGEGMGKALWLDEVQCRGNEERLESCAHAGWGVSNCGHRNDVGVVCKTEPPVTARLVNATGVAGQVSGRLELLWQGSWVPVCRSGLNNIAATVVCKQLRLGTAGTVVPGTAARQGSFQRLRSISCTGREASWEACGGTAWASSPCDTLGEAGISCTGAAPTIRLVSPGAPAGSRVMQGRLEVKLPSGAWSTVCDDLFSDAAASIACRQLGLSSTGYAVPGAVLGQGTGPIAWDGVVCKGTESTLQECPRSATVDCTHREDVGVVCLGSNPRVTPAPEQLQLVNGTKTSGRLMVLYQGVWGTVCFDGFTPAAATVACRQLGLTGGAVLARGFAGQGTGQIWLDDLKCTGSEAALSQCQHSPWGVHNCWHSDDVAISCGAAAATPPLRLVNGTAQMGRLEIRFNEAYGTVCSDEYGWSFNSDAAAVVCRQLGLPPPALAIRGAVFGAGPAKQPIWLNNVFCWGDEKKLESCQHDAWGGGSCPGHASDVAIACNATVALRLTNGTSPNSGRLELAINGLWGVAVASKQFDAAAATVACRQLGLPTPGRTLPGGYFGPGPAKGPLWLRSIFCMGSEAKLQECKTGLDAGLLWGVAPEEGYDRTTAVAIACGF